MASSRSRSRYGNLLFAVGLLSSAVALTASYLYFTTPSDQAHSSSHRPRRKIIVSSNSAEELLRIIPKDAIETDEIYVTLLHAASPSLRSSSQSNGHDTQRDNDDADDDDDDDDERLTDLEDRCAYLLHHQRGQGLTHIVRHVSPTLVLIAPSMSHETKVEEIKDWVGTVVVVGDGVQAGNVKYLSDSENIYKRALSV